MLFGITPWQHKNEKVLLKLMNDTPLPSEHLGSLSNQKLVQFMTKACQPIERKRMGIAELEEFSFWAEGMGGSEVEMKSEVGSRAFAKTMTSDKMEPVTTCPSQVSTAVSTAQNNSREEVFKGNCLVIER